MARSTISIAMCTYNGLPYLEEQLASITAQTRLPDELIICDDGSTDASLQVLASFAAASPFPVHLFRNAANLGSTRNFEQAIRHCTGETIVLADQDDVWLPEKLAVFEATLQARPDAGAVFSDAEIIDAQSRPLGYRLWPSFFFTGKARALVDAGKAYELLVRHNVVTGATMAFRAAFRESLLPIPASWVHDHWIAVLIAAQAALLALPEPLVRYRRHQQQQIGVVAKDAAVSPLRRELRRAGNRLGQPTFDNEASQTSFRQTVAQYAALRERLAAMPTACHQVAALHAVDAKIRHYSVRAGLPVSRAQRVAPILAELLAFRYHRYSSGLFSAARDLVA